MLPSQDRKLVKEKVKEILPKTEKLKEQLRLQFEDEYQLKVSVYAVYEDKM